MSSEQKKLSHKYLLYKFTSNLWFLSAVWLYFYRLFITDQQIGILDGIAFTIGLIAEVPSGALADKFGRDRLVKLGQILAGTGLIIQVLGSAFIPFVVGQAIMMIGVAFVSGADQALFFENMKFDEDSKEWRKLVTRGSQSALIAILIATVGGGLLHNLNPILPWYLNGLAFIASALVIWNIKDTRPKKERHNFLPELRSYFKDIRTGFSQYKLPRLSIYVLFIIAVQGLFYTYSFGLLKLVLLDRFGFDTFAGSIVLASFSLITVGVLSYMHKKAEKISEKSVLSIIGLVTVGSLLLSVLNVGLWGYFILLALYASEYILEPIMSEVLNKNAPEDQRATTLSVASFFKNLPYIVLAPLIGTLNTTNKLEYFLVGWALFVLVAVIIYLLGKRRDVRLTIDEFTV